VAPAMGVRWLAGAVASAMAPATGVRPAGMAAPTPAPPHCRPGAALLQDRLGGARSPAGASASPSSSTAWARAAAGGALAAALAAGLQPSARRGRGRRRCLRGRAAASAFGEVFEAEPVAEESQALIVWLHGLGDTGKGWSDTAPALQQMGLPELRFLFPTAPVRDVGSRGPSPSWYDVVSLNPDDIAQQDSSPAGLAEAAEEVLNLVEPHVRRGLPPGRVFLAGYSQGGGLALAAALRAPRPLGGVLMLSSWVAEPLPSDFTPVPVHLFHGAEDNVVPASTAQRCRAALEELGLEVSLRVYPGMTHGVCDQEVGDIAQTLYEALH